MIRLLTYKPSSNDFELVAFHSDPPPYAILSHTWTEGQEVTYDELLAGTEKDKAGYAKIRFCRERVDSDGYKYFWVDTCCINKSSRAELQTAIASMFQWYKRAAKCYVYLPDVSMKKRKRGDENLEWKQAFRKSRWFTRGWTLQELIAPASVEFFSSERQRLGYKQSVEQEIHEITGIPVKVLQGDPLGNFSVTKRKTWMVGRQTAQE